MAKVLLSYEFEDCGWPSCCDDKWSFTVFERGDVILRKRIDSEKSSYEFTIPHDVAARLNDYLAAHMEIIDALPESFAYGFDGWMETYVFLGKAIKCWCLTYNKSVQSMLNHPEIKQITDEGQTTDSESVMKNTLIEMFVEACGILAPYGVTVNIDNEYGLLKCEWNISDHS